MNLKDLSVAFKNELSGLYDDEESQSLFLLAIKHTLDYSRADYLLKGQEEIATNFQLKLSAILNDLKHGTPIQYIIGYAEFFKLRFKVNPSVLIPRPETEELVEWILAKCQDTNKNLNVLDIGTGSGCIAIALKKNLPTASVSAVDFSPTALHTAQENAELNGTDVAFIKGDILDTSFTSTLCSTAFDLIISNPPYVKEDEKSAMHQNVLANEPHSALFVSNDEPLVFYEAIADFAKISLRENGLLFFEINEYLANETIQLLVDKGFINIELKKDMQGKDRMVLAMKPNH